MIDTVNSNPAQQRKVIYVRHSGALGLIISDGKTEQGKWRIVDMCIGNINEAITELKQQGYTVEEF